MNLIVQELQVRFAAMFDALSRGDDVPPATRLRCEGVMEAAVLSGELTTAGIDELLEAQFLAAFGCSLDAEFGSDWRELFPFPQIPAMARRAPVYPSTRD